MRWLVLAAALAAGCRPAPASGGAAGGDNVGDRGQGEAEILARELYELVDRAADYKGSHRGRNAISLRQIGIDSLTSRTARHISVASGSAIVTVLFRQAGERAVRGCWADDGILEEAALRGGLFTVTCSGPSGRPMVFEVSGGTRR